jgi:hypothetical protein
VPERPGADDPEARNCSFASHLGVVALRSEPRYELARFAGCRSPDDHGLSLYPELTLGWTGSIVAPIADGR